MDAYLGQTQDIILGQDFLTWLWFKSEIQNGQFTTTAGETFELHIEQRVSVQGGEGESLETASVAGAMSELKEVRLGLVRGKKVTRALVRIEVDSEIWLVTLKAEDFSINSLRTPKIKASHEDNYDLDAKFLEKIYLIERGLNILDGVFCDFLALRLSDGWPKEVASVLNWIVETNST
ncbi:conserved hypothetical protein [Desulfovibrionales bacterium]